MDLSSILNMEKSCTKLNPADILPGGIIKLRTVDQRVFFVSDGMLDLINCTREEFAQFSDVKWFLRKIHPDDIDRFCREMIEQLRENNKVETEFRLQKKSGEYIWVKLYSGFVSEGEDKVFLECMVLDNSQIRHVQEEITRIADYKRQTAFFKRQAQHDLLTGLLNKMTSEEHIDSYLSNTVVENLHALFIIDIDDFKSVNDYMGHLIGDLVLTEISDGIHHLFREGDIIGRIGGDEFVVFMKDVASRESVCKKARGLSKILKMSCGSVEKNHQISGSIGIAIYPHDGKTYKELYKRADKALYLSKRNGKDCFSFFDEL